MKIEPMTAEQMDAAAKEAEVELKALPNEVLAQAAAWFKKHYLRAGYKRLGRTLIKYAPPE